MGEAEWAARCLAELTGTRPAQHAHLIQGVTGFCARGATDGSELAGVCHGFAVVGRVSNLYSKALVVVLALARL